MKLKKVLLQIGLLLAFVGVVNGAQVVARADTMTSLTDKKLAGVYVRSADFVDHNSNDIGSSLYPNLIDVSANGVVDGRITKNTTTITITYEDSAVTKSGVYDKFHADVMALEDGKAVSLATNSLSSWAVTKTGTSSGTATAPKNTPTIFNMFNSDPIPTTINVDLSKLGSKPKLPIYVGFSYTGYSSQHPSTLVQDYYGEIALSGDNDTVSKMKDITINDSNDKPTTTVSPTDTVVKGTGEPEATATLSGVSGDDGKYSATIDSEGNYSIDLGGSSLKDLGNPSTITVTESNQFGDTKSATADVKDSVALTTTAANSSVAVDPDTLASNITGKSDADILAWLSGQSAAGLTTTKEGSTTALTDADGLTYTADTTDLASKIATATAADPLTINVSASDSAGDKTTATTPIKIYPTDGTFKFNSLSDFAFGTLPVPAQETLFAPTNTPSILIDDTQTVGKDWYVTANATKMTDSANNDLNGNMVYVDADGAKHNLTNTTTLVGQGQRESGKTTAEVADGWANAGATVAASKFTDGAATGVTKGVYLDAQPNIYTGGVADGNKYTGSIQWTLTNSVSGS